MAVNELFLPAVAVIPTQRDKEILFSGDDYMQKGGTFAMNATAGPDADGLLPSGTVVSRLGDGRYAAYHGTTPVEANESVSIAVDATGGTFTITFRGGTTGAIAFNAIPAVVQAALELLPEVEVGDIIVSGGPGSAGHATPYVLAFSQDGQYADEDAPAITTTPASLTGGAGTAAVTTTAGAAGATDGTGTAVGVLRSALDISAADQLGNIVFVGHLKIDQLVGLDAGAIEDLKARETFPNCLSF